MGRAEKNSAVKAMARSASKALSRPVALAYASESMRMTTRLMQIASWLLLRRAVNDTRGHLSELLAKATQGVDLDSPGAFIHIFLNLMKARGRMR